MAPPLLRAPAALSRPLSLATISVCCFLLAISVGSVLASSMARVRKGMFHPEEAQDLLDKLLRQGTLPLGHELNGFLAALARAPPSIAYRYGPAFAVALFNPTHHFALGKALYSVNILSINGSLSITFFGHLVNTLSSVEKHSAKKST
jgi:hypothetical protein